MRNENPVLDTQSRDVTVRAKTVKRQLQTPCGSHNAHRALVSGLTLRLDGQSCISCQLCSYLHNRTHTPRTHMLSLSHSPLLSLSLSHSRTHTQTHHCHGHTTCALSLSLSSSFFLSLSLTHTTVPDTHVLYLLFFLSVSPFLSLSDTHTHALSLSLSLTHTHTYTGTHRAWFCRWCPHPSLSFMPNWDLPFHELALRWAPQIFLRVYVLTTEKLPCVLLSFTFASLSAEKCGYHTRNINSQYVPIYCYLHVMLETYFRFVLLPWSCLQNKCAAIPVTYQKHIYCVYLYHWALHRSKIYGLCTKVNRLGSMINYTPRSYHVVKLSSVRTRDLYDVDLSCES